MNQTEILQYLFSDFEVPTFKQLDYITIIEHYSPNKFKGVSKFEAQKYICLNQKFIYRRVVDCPLYEKSYGDGYSVGNDAFYKDWGDCMGSGIHCADDMNSNCW